MAVGEPSTRNAQPPKPQALKPEPSEPKTLNPPQTPGNARVVQVFNTGVGGGGGIGRNGI